MKKQKFKINKIYSKSAPVNVLFTSVANKISLVESFKEASAVFGISGKIIGVDIDPYSAGLYCVDHGYLVPKLTDKTFLIKIKNILRKEKISLIIPTRDEDLLYFSKNKNKFEKIGVRVLVSEYESVEICADKWKFFQFLKLNSISTIETWQRPANEIKFPCIVKPRIGKGGVGVQIIKNKKELGLCDLRHKIIQEKIEGTEYTIDYFADFNGRPISIVPRIRLKIAQGESKVGITKNELKIIELVKEVGQALGLIGHNTVQCFKLKNGSLKILEINPRFGGGASLGMAAGCKSPEYIFRLLRGEILKEQKNFTENLVMIRYSKDLFLPYDKIINI